MPGARPGDHALRAVQRLERGLIGHGHEPADELDPARDGVEKVRHPERRPDPRRHLDLPQDERHSERGSEEEEQPAARCREDADDVKPDDDEKDEDGEGIVDPEGQGQEDAGGRVVDVPSGRRPRSPVQVIQRAERQEPRKDSERLKGPQRHEQIQQGRVQQTERAEESAAGGRAEEEVHVQQSQREGHDRPDGRLVDVPGTESKHDVLKEDAEVGIVDVEHRMRLGSETDGQILQPRRVAEPEPGEVHRADVRLVALAAVERARQELAPRPDVDMLDRQQGDRHGQHAPPGMPRHAGPRAHYDRRR